MYIVIKGELSAYISHCWFVTTQRSQIFKIFILIFWYFYLIWNVKVSTISLDCFNIFKLIHTSDPKGGKQNKQIKLNPPLFVQYMLKKVHSTRKMRNLSNFRAHNFGQLKKHALLKAGTQSPCFSHPGLVRAFQSAGSADLLSFGPVCVGWPPDLLCWLLVYERAKMRPVYSFIVGLTGFLSIFCIK